MQRSVQHHEASSPPALLVPSSFRGPFAQPVVTSDEPRPSRLALSTPTASSSRTAPALSEADQKVASLRRQFEAAEQRNHHLEARLREENVARDKVEHERDRYKSVALSLHRLCEQAGQDKHARQAAEVELGRLKSAAQARDQELEETRAALASAQKEVERLDVERKDAIRAIVQAEDDLHGRILEDGNELIGLREQVVALLLEQSELQDELDRLTRERDALLLRVEEATADFERLKAATSRAQADLKVQIEAKSADLAAARHEAEQARARCASEIRESRWLLEFVSVRVVPSPISSYPGPFLASEHSSAPLETSIARSPGRLGDGSAPTPPSGRHARSRSCRARRCLQRPRRPLQICHARAHRQGRHNLCHPGRARPPGSLQCLVGDGSARSTGNDTTTAFQRGTLPPVSVSDDQSISSH